MYFSNSMNKYHAANLLQTQMIQTEKWLHDWKISIYPSEPVAVLFGDKNASNMRPLRVHNQDVHWSNSVKYLGIRLDSKLTFTKHVNDTYNKARRIRAVLYPILCKDCPLPIGVKITILKMYITSILTYAGPAWAELISENQWKMFNAVQNIALRTITNSPWFVRNPVLHQSSGIKDIKQFIIQATHNMFHKSTTSSFPHLQSLGLTNATIEWKQNRPASLLELT